MGLKEWFIPRTQRTVKQQIAVGISLLILMSFSALAGAIGGMYYTTGNFPGDAPLTILPEIEGPTTTLIDVGHFLERDKTNEVTYEEGFNCVEYGLLVAREAHWSGLPAEVGSLVFEGTEIRHMVLLFPLGNIVGDTTGTPYGIWAIVDPQADLVINPRVGALYNGQKVIRIDILRATWEVFSE